MILQVDNVSLRFGGLQALDRVSFEAQEGEVLGIIGPNGAGKTTLFNVINGVYRPQAGRVTFQGEDITGLPPFRIAHRGIARTHQVVRPLGELTVKENVTVGACFGSKNLPLREAGYVAGEVLTLVGLEARSEMLASKLNVAQKRRLELARALAAEPTLLLMDEVLSGLNQSEVAEMLVLVRLINSRGVTVLMIEHLMHAVMNVCSRVLVLNYGAKIAEGTPQQVSNDKQVIEAYLGDPAVAARFLEDAP